MKKMRRNLGRSSLGWRATCLWLAGMAGISGVVQEVSAHGAVGFPIARQYQCHLDGGYWSSPDGSGIPHADCLAAYRAGDNSAYPFVQWNEVSANPRNPDNFDEVKRAVPDGLLCAGGDPRKQGLDRAPTTLWRKTKITPEMVL